MISHCITLLQKYLISLCQTIFTQLVDFDARVFYVLPFLRNCIFANFLKCTNFSFEQFHSGELSKTSFAGFYFSLWANLWWVWSFPSFKKIHHIFGLSALSMLVWLVAICPSKKFLDWISYHTVAFKSAPCMFSHCVTFQKTLSTESLWALFTLKSLIWRM